MQRNWQSSLQIVRQCRITGRVQNAHEDTSGALCDLLTTSMHRDTVATLAATDSVVYRSLWCLRVVQNVLDHHLPNVQVIQIRDDQPSP
jgi:hypothetical protein